jgi:hypothetical protein
MLSGQVMGKNFSSRRAGKGLSKKAFIPAWYDFP